ncbi:MAG TPA: hypothetical protein DCE42_31180 [Myxococcales bacterium]|nr:hypothetical protein [Deltaproteobacteria bacterium]MBU49866.1 hypothetical protein [Deltaproteobacteria bacterium]HAA59253.1 hypothetical protein [Myxococcales bacterium]
MSPHRTKKSPTKVNLLSPSRVLPDRDTNTPSQHQQQHKTNNTIFLLGTPSQTNPSVCSEGPKYTTKRTTQPTPLIHCIPTWR